MGGFTLGYGKQNWGNFLSFDGMNTSRFLDAPEFVVFHDRGNEQNVFDLTRGLLWILLPGSLLGAVLLVAQGVPMNFHSYVPATTLEEARQVLSKGPVAALEIIKNLGTNGGGFFNANGAHPYENQRH